MSLLTKATGFFATAAGAIAGGMLDGMDKATRRPSKGERIMASMMMPGGITSYPGGWVADKIEQVRHYRGWAGIANRAICNEGARHLPSIAYRHKPGTIDKSDPRILPRRIREKAIAPHVQNNEELELVDFDHPLLELLHNPNELDTGFTFWFRTFLFSGLTGESYWLKVRNGFGTPVELWPLMSHWMQPVGGNGRLIDYYNVRPVGFGFGSPLALTVPADDVVAFRDPNPLTLTAGWSPLMMGAEWVDIAEGIDSQRWYTLENKGWADMLIELDGKTFGQQSVPETEINRLYARLGERIGGKQRAGRPVVLGPGMKAAKFSQTNQELDLVQSADQMRDWNLCLYGISKAVVGITTEQNFASALVARAQFIHDTMGPKRAMYGQTVTKELAQKDFDPKLVAFWPDLAPEDPDAKREDQDMLFKNQAQSPNGLRTAYGLEPWDKGGNNPMGPPTLVELPFQEDVSEDVLDALRGDEDEEDTEGGDDEGGEVPDFDEATKSARFEEGKHPRGQPDNAGKFGPGGGHGSGGGRREKPSSKPAKPSKGKQTASAATAESGIKVKPAKGRAFSGKPVPVKNPISKQEAGRIGEEVVIGWLKSRGLTDARHMNLDRNNFPIDLVQDHAVIEVKTGLVSNSEGAQQWRLTIGEPGKKEKEWLATASPEEKAAWNERKQQMIHERKKGALAALSKELGVKVKARTITVLLNPDTKMADIHVFDGWHDRIGWKSELAKQSYKTSVSYA